MYPASFEYLAPTTLDDAIAHLDEHGDDGKVLAGGQSLIPLMKLRFAAPAALIDINGVADLGDAIVSEADGIVDRRAASATRTASAPSICAARYRDPRPCGAADLRPDRPKPRDGVRLARARRPAGRLGVGAARGRRGGRDPRTGRRVPHELHRRSARRPVHDDARGRTRSSPRCASRTRAARAGGTYLKLERKVGDFATVGVAVHVVALERARSPGPASPSPASVPTNMRARAAEEALAGRAPDEDAIKEAARAGGRGRRAPRRRARDGRVQAERRARLHRARAAPGRCRGPAGQEGG